jgi:hypothetical protein
VEMFFTATFMGSMQLPDDLVYGSDEMMQIIQKVYDKMTAYSTQITSATALLMIPAVVLLFRRDWKRRYEFGIQKAEQVSLGHYILLIPLGIIACIVSNNIISMSELALYSDSYQSTSEALYSASLPVMLVGLGIIVPIAEEFMFRGLLYNRIKDLVSWKKAWVLSALLFGVYHGNLVQGIYGFLAGLLLVYVYEKYGSMRAPIVLHAVLNMTSVLISKTGGFDWMFTDMIRVCVITVIGGMLLGFCLMYLVGIKHTVKEKDQQEENGQSM